MNHINKYDQSMLQNLDSKKFVLITDRYNGDL